MSCEKKIIELKPHAVLVYENVLFADGRSLAFRLPLNAEYFLCIKATLYSMQPFQG
jgi:hypothetical protein